MAVAGHMPYSSATAGGGVSSSIGAGRRGNAEDRKPAAEGSNDGIRSNDTNTGVTRVDPERALEFLTVADARELLDTTRKDVGDKQAELQLMVGSRYPELIESADSILSMRDGAEQVVHLLSILPQECNRVLECLRHGILANKGQAASHLHDGGDKEAVDSQGASGDANKGRKAGSSLGGGSEEEGRAAMRLILNAPSAMWSALDSDQFLEAASLFMRCQEVMAGDALANLSGDEASSAAFVRSQWTYIKQFPQRIVMGATATLAHVSHGSRSSGSGIDEKCCEGGEASSKKGFADKTLRGSGGGGDDEEEVGHESASGVSGGGLIGRDVVLAASNACAKALAAVYLLEGRKVANPLQGALELLLRQRGLAIIRSLKRGVGGPVGSGEASKESASGKLRQQHSSRQHSVVLQQRRKLESRLSVTVRLIQQTLQDVHTCFVALPVTGGGGKTRNISSSSLPPPSSSSQYSHHHKRGFSAGGGSFSDSNTLSSSSSSSMLSTTTIHNSTDGITTSGGGSGDNVCLLWYLVKDTMKTWKFDDRQPEKEYLQVLPEKLVKDLCTKWLALVVPRVQRRTDILLRGVGDAHTLAAVRQALYKLTSISVVGKQGEEGRTDTYDSTGSLASRNGKMSPHERGSGEGGGGGGGALVISDTFWREACDFAVNSRLLSRGLSAAYSRKDVYVSVDDVVLVDEGGLHLWHLLFSKTFAELAETMLTSRLYEVRDEITGELRQLLSSLTGTDISGADTASSGTSNGKRSNDTTGTTTTTAAPAGSGSGRRRSRMMAHEVLSAADSIVVLLTRRLLSVSRDAWSLVQQGDKAAASALEVSLFLRCAEVVTSIMTSLRCTLEDIQKEAATCRGSDRWGPTEAALVVGRLAWLLAGPRGQALRDVLEVPEKLVAASHDRIDADQLEAAFEIADTDGDGVMDIEESEEALQAISVVGEHHHGDGAALAINEQLYRSFTIDEFKLLTIALLNNQEPVACLSNCLQHIERLAAQVWADCVFEGPSAILSAGFVRLVKACRTKGVDDATWRSRLGLWEKKYLRLSVEEDSTSSPPPPRATDDDDNGDADEIQEELWIPTGLSPFVQSYIQEVAMELGNLACTADFMTTGLAERGGGRRGLLEWARELAVERLKKNLLQSYNELCVGDDAALQQACESAHLQMLLDTMVLSRWFNATSTSTSTLHGSSSSHGGDYEFNNGDKDDDDDDDDDEGGGGGDRLSMPEVHNSVCELVDPINLQLYMTHLESACTSSSASSALLLAALFAPLSHAGTLVNDSSHLGSGGSRRWLVDIVSSSSSSLTNSLTARGRHEDYLTGLTRTTNMVALAPRVARFDLLPLPLNLGRPETGSSLLGDGARAGGGVNGSGVAPAEEGLPGDGLKGVQDRAKTNAGQQAFAGFTGNVRSMLQEKQPLQNIFGAASSFLGGGRR